MQTTFKQAIRQRQLELLARQQWTTIIGSSLVALILFYFFRNEVSNNSLQKWLVVFFTIITARCITISCYQYIPNTLSTQRWFQLFISLIFITGLIWGMGVFIFYLPNKPELVVMYACMYIGLTSASSVSLAVYFPAYFAFITPCILPLVGRGLFENNIVYSVIGISLFLFYLAHIFIGYNTNKSIIKTFSLEFEKEGLIKKLSEEKRISEASQKKAELAIKDKNHFLASVSHDLRQPLHATGLLTDLLKKHIQTNDGKEILNNIIQANQNINHTFSGLLDLSQLDANVIQPRFTACYLDPLLQRLIFQQQAAVKAKNLKIYYQDTAVIVYSDALLLERVIQNILSNAIRYTPEGSIRISINQKHQHAYLTIQDTGIGIAKEDIDNIFKDYYQIGNSERDAEKGFGLGLAIVDKLCKLLGIDIETHSVLEQGTSFILKIPLAHTNIDDAAKVSEQSVLSNQTQQHYNIKTILLIDDDQRVAEAMQQRLQDEGFTVLLATSATDALAVLNQNDCAIDFIIADYRLRDNKTGVQAVLTIREELNTSTPAIILTGDTSADIIDVVESQRLPIFHKPLDPEKLLQHLASY